MKHAIVLTILVLLAVSGVAHGSETCEPNTPCAREPNVPPHILRRALEKLRIVPVRPVPPKGPPPLELLPEGATGWVPVPSRKPGIIMFVPQWPAHPGYCAPPPGMNVPYPCPPNSVEQDTVKQEDEKNCLSTGARCPVKAVPEPGAWALVCAALGAAWAMRRRACA